MSLNYKYICYKDKIFDLRYYRFHQRRLGLESHKKRFDIDSQAFFFCFFCSRRLISFALGVRNDVAFRCTTLTAERHGRTNPFASANYVRPSKVAHPTKDLTNTVRSFLLVALHNGTRYTSTATGVRNDVAFRCTTLTAETFLNLQFFHNITVSFFVRLIILKKLGIANNRFVRSFADIRFYATHKFYSFEDFEAQLSVHLRPYNAFPMRPLGWLSPKQYISDFLQHGLLHN